MGGSEEGYPAWVLRVLFLTALAMVLAAVLVWLAPGVIAGRSILAIHCLGNGLILYAAWNTHRSHVEASALLQLAARLGALAFGIVDLVLAGRAASEFTPGNALLLALAIPGAAGVLAIEIEGLRKSTPAENEITDEIALAKEDESDILSPGETLRTAVGPVIFYTVYWGSCLAGLMLATMWFYIVWDAVNHGAAFDFWNVVDLLMKSVESNARYLLTMTGFFAVVMAGAFVGPLLLRPFKRMVKRYRRGDDPAIEAQVESRLRAVWDYANAPAPKGMTFSVFILPAILFGLAAAGAVAFGTYDHDIAFRLMATRHQPIDGWIVFDNSTTGLLYVIVAAAMAAWSLWHVIVDRRTDAAAYLMTLKYRRNSDNVGRAVKWLRARLRDAVKKGGDAPFDPRAFLLASRRRSGRWLYGITAVCIVIGAWGGWAGLNSYTMLTPDGIEDVSGYSGTRDVRSWTDVRRIDIHCTLNHKGDTSFDWDAGFADGRSIGLFRSDDIGRHLPELIKMDAILRERGVDFHTLNPAGRSRVTQECLDKLGGDASDRRGFLRLMHQD